MKWMWFAVWVCTMALYTIEELRIADAENRAAAAEAWAETVEAEAEMWLEKAGAGR
jgi:hypothetical protein